MTYIAPEPVKLGTIVMDELTGFTGVVISRAEYLYGCVRVEVQPKELKEDGSLPEAQWFDEIRVSPSLTGHTPDEEPYPVPEEVTGGPERSTPPSRDPK